MNSKTWASRLGVDNNSQWTDRKKPKNNLHLKKLSPAFKKTNKKNSYLLAQTITEVCTV